MANRFKHALGQLHISIQTMEVLEIVSCLVVPDGSEGSTMVIEHPPITIVFDLDVELL